MRHLPGMRVSERLSQKFLENINKKLNLRVFYLYSRLSPREIKISRLINEIEEVFMAADGLTPLVS
jgi:hypothetical protein